MPIIKNPFARRGAPVAHDDHYRERGGGGGGHGGAKSRVAPGFERVETVGSIASSSGPLSIRSGRSQDMDEYKMSVVDSGVYLPPSPAEDKSTWPRRYLLSRTSSDNRSNLSEIEHFSISRESFDSYRRSFDISAKSPIVSHESPARHSVDSARFARPPRTSLADRRAAIGLETPADEESFEDVGLEDQPNKPAPRKRGFFSKFTESTPEEPSSPVPGAAAPSVQSTSNSAILHNPMSRFLIPGRKRGHSQGKELGAELAFVTRAPATEMGDIPQDVH